MGRSESRRKGRSERKVTKKHYSDSSDSSDSSYSHMGRSRSRMGRSESRRKGRSERKVTKKHYSDSSDSSDSHMGRSERKVTKKYYSDSSDSRKGRSESHLKGLSERKVTKKHYLDSSDSSDSRKGSSESRSENVAKISKRERIIGNPYVYFGETLKIVRILGLPFSTVPGVCLSEVLVPPAQDWSQEEVLWAMGRCYHIAFNAQFESLASVKIEELEYNNGRGEIKDTMKSIAATYLGQRAGESYESYKKKRKNSDDRV